ncbi:MAG: hypothetical protein JXB48_02380 [Candidatus Latescibacteria bacterium]|nr:hypothetical protein [Candidatus Latescibacterota bacterium]
MSGRRTFIRNTAAGIAAAAVAGGAKEIRAAEEQTIDPRKPFRRTSRYKSELVTIGMVGGRHGTHTNGIWGQNWNPDDTHIRTTGMNGRYVWCLRDEDKQYYRDKYGFEPVKNPEDMIGYVDGVVVDDFYATPVNHLMAKPFLEAGVPTFVNRPCSTSMAKARMLTDTADKHGTPLMCGSTWEYTESCGDVRSSLRDVKEIKGYVAHNSMSDYYTHGVHGIYYIYSCLKDEIKKGRGKAVTASYITRDWRKPGGCITFEHECPEGFYYGSLHEPSGANGNAYIRVFGSRPFDVEGKIPGAPGYFRYNTWNAMQLVIQEMFETKKSPEESFDILEKTAMFLMAFKSVLHNNCGPVRREELEGWELVPPSDKLLASNSESGNTAYTVDELKQIARVFGGDYVEP